MLFVG